MSSLRPSIGQKSAVAANLLPFGIDVLLAETETAAAAPAGSHFCITGQFGSAEPDTTGAGIHYHPVVQNIDEEFAEANLLPAGTAALEKPFGERAVDHRASTPRGTASRALRTDTTPSFCLGRIESRVDWDVDESKSTEELQAWQSTLHKLGKDSFKKIEAHLQKPNNATTDEEGYNIIPFSYVECGGETFNVASFRLFEELGQIEIRWPPSSRSKVYHLEEPMSSGLSTSTRKGASNRTQSAAVRLEAPAGHQFLDQINSFERFIYWEQNSEPARDELAGLVEHLEEEVDDLSSTVRRMQLEQLAREPRTTQKPAKMHETARASPRSNPSNGKNGASDSSQALRTGTTPSFCLGRIEFKEGWDFDVTKSTEELQAWQATFHKLGKNSFKKINAYLKKSNDATTDEKGYNIIPFSYVECGGRTFNVASFRLFEVLGQIEIRWPPSPRSEVYQLEEPMSTGLSTSTRRGASNKTLSAAVRLEAPAEPQRAKQPAVRLEAPAEPQRAKQPAVPLEDVAERQRAQQAALQLEDVAERQRAHQAAVQLEDVAERQRAQQAAVQLEDFAERQRAKQPAVPLEDVAERQRAQQAAVQLEDFAERQRAKQPAVPLEDVAERQRAQQAALQLEDVAERQRAQQAAVQLEDFAERQRAQQAAVQLEDVAERQRAQQAAVQLEDFAERQRAKQAAVQLEDVAERQRAQQAAVPLVVPIERRRAQRGVVPLGVPIERRRARRGAVPQEASAERQFSDQPNPFERFIYREQNPEPVRDELAGRFEHLEEVMDELSSTVRRMQLEQLKREDTLKRQGMKSAADSDEDAASEDGRLHTDGETPTIRMTRKRREPRRFSPDFSEPANRNSAPHPKKFSQMVKDDDVFENPQQRGQGESQLRNKKSQDEEEEEEDSEMEEDSNELEEGDIYQAEQEEEGHSEKKEDSDEYEKDDSYQEEEEEEEEEEEDSDF